MSIIGKHDRSIHPAGIGCTLCDTPPDHVICNQCHGKGTVPRSLVTCPDCGTELDLAERLMGRCVDAPDCATQETDPE